MPLCAHPDLPGQVADLIHPEAHPGWEPVKPTVAEPHASTVAEPHARTVAEPDAPTVAESDAPTVAEPHALTVAESDALTVAEPHPGARFEIVKIPRKSRKQDDPAAGVPVTEE